VCDGKSLNEKYFNGMTNFDQSKFIPRFICENCDFVLWEKYMNLFKEKFYYKINKYYKIPILKHSLKYLEKTGDNNWAWYGRNLKDSCLSGTTEFKQTKVLKDLDMINVILNNLKIAWIIIKIKMIIILYFKIIIKN
jgi:hypothetical protein